MRRLLVGWFSTVLLASGQAALAGALTDGSLGPRVERSGDFKIGARLGTRQGDNLFHSFERFSIETGERATFTGAPTIRNVVSRVTGGAPSTIDGVLRSEVGSADFYFINPAGVLFGPNASLEVPAAFHVSTADELRFANGDVFSAGEPAAGSLSLAAPEAFGFLGGTPGTIVVDRSFLQVPTGETLTLIGGDITIDGGLAEFPVGDDGLPIVPPQDPVGALFAPSGRIALVAADGKAEVVLGDEKPVVPKRGDISLINHSGLFVNGNGGGDVSAIAGRLYMDGFSAIGSINDGFSDADGAVTIDVENLELRNASLVDGSTVGSGDGTPVGIRAGLVEIDTGLARLDLPGERPILTASIIADSRGDAFGDAGDIKVRASEIRIVGTGVISSSTAGIGDAGLIDVMTSSLLIQGVENRFGSLAGIFSDAEPGSEGNAGDVKIKGQQVQILNGGTIGTNTFSVGDAGTVTVKAEEILLRGVADDRPASIRSDGRVGSRGQAGSVTVTAGQLRLVDGGVIGSGTFGARAAGRVTVEADDLLIDGAGSDLLTGITTQATSESTGNAGRVRVEANHITLLNGGKIESDANASGNAGRVRIIAGELELLHGGEVRSAAFATGNAGTVQIDADRIVIRGPAADFTGIASAAAGGRSGVVRLQVGDSLLLDQGSISTDSRSAGGGEIQIMVDNVVDLRDSAVTTSVIAGTDPTAGNIRIDPDVLVIDNSRIEADAPDGFGGNVALMANAIVVPRGDFAALLTRGDISATGDGPTRAGTVVVHAPETELVDDLVVLQAPLLDATALLRQPCAARRDVGANSFTATGHGGLPATPDALLPGIYVTDTTAAASTSMASSPRLLAAGCASLP